MKSLKLRITVSALSILLVVTVAGKRVTARAAHPPRTETLTSQPVRCFALNGTGTQLAVCEYPIIGVLNLATRHLSKIVTFKEVVDSIALSDDCRYVAAESWDAVHVWNVKTGKELQTPYAVNPTYVDRDTDLIVHSRTYHGLTFVGRSDMIAISVRTASADNDIGSSKIVLWDTSANKEIDQIPLPFQVSGIASSSDGSVLVAGCLPEKVEIVRVASGTVTAFDLKPDIHSISCVGISSDHMSVIVGTTTGNCYLVSINQMRILSKWSRGPGFIFSAAFCNRNRTVVVSSTDSNDLKFYDASRAKLIATVNEPLSPISQLVYVNGRDELLGEDSRFRVWRMISVVKSLNLSEGTRTGAP